MTWGYIRKRFCGCEDPVSLLHAACVDWCWRSASTLKEESAYVIPDAYILAAYSGTGISDTDGFGI